MRKLTTRALIGRDKDSGILTVHRLIQTQFPYLSLSLEQSQKAFNDTGTLIFFVLPNGDMEKGQVYDTWEGYNQDLHYILRLGDIFEEERKAPTAFSAPQKSCEILNEFQRYVVPSLCSEEALSQILFWKVPTLSSSISAIS
jgi:hypothetical protein